jgi:plastocyanin
VKTSSRNHLKTLLGFFLLFNLLLSPSVGLAEALEQGVEIVEAGDMTSWSYSPALLTVQAGTTVTWRNTGTLAHSVTSEGLIFDSRLMEAGKSWSFVFDTPGTYRYFCVPRPWMKGTILVTAAEEQDSSQ